MDATEIKQRVPILDAIRHYRPHAHLRPEGDHFKSLCPFHNDSQPSFVVYPKTNTYQCYGACDETGDAIRFVERLLGDDFKAACRRLIRDFHLHNGSERTRKPKSATGIAESLPLAANAAMDKLKRERGLREETIAHFQIVANPELQRWEYPVVQNSEVVARRGKAFDSNADPKYVWIPKSPGAIVYGIDELDGAEECWLVNGEPAMWVCKQVGEKAVCTCTSEATKPDTCLRILADRGVKRLKVLADLDEAGIKGAAKRKQIAQSLGITTTVHQPPADLGKAADACDIYRSGRFDDEAFRKVLATLPELLPEQLNITRQSNERVVKSLREEYCARFDGLVDIVESDGKPKFLVKTERRLEILEAVERDGKHFVPPPAEQLKWLLARGDEVLKFFPDDDESDLFDSLVSWHKAVSELPSEDWYELLAAYDLLTWLVDSVHYCPILWFYAVPERGKTRTGRGIIFVAYRGLHTESVREAYIFRFAQELGGTILFDVMNLWQKAERAGSEDILNARVEQGVTVPRVNRPEKGPFRSTDFYDVFGPTIIATNEDVSPILQTRALRCVMPVSQREFCELIPDAVLELRERLTSFRARHLGEELPIAEKPVAGRLGDLTRPLCQIVRLVKPSALPKLQRLIHALENERQADKGESIAGRVVRALLTLPRNDEDIVMTARITEAVFPDIDEKAKDSHSRRIGKRMRQLGFQRKKTEAGERGWQVDRKLLEQLALEYGARDNVQNVQTSKTASGNGSRVDVSSDVSVTSVKRQADKAPFQATPDVLDVSDVCSQFAADDSANRASRHAPCDCGVEFSSLPEDLELPDDLGGDDHGG